MKRVMPRYVSFLYACAGGFEYKAGFIIKNEDFLIDMRRAKMHRDCHRIFLKSVYVIYILSGMLSMKRMRIVVR